MSSIPNYDLIGNVDKMSSSIPNFYVKKSSLDFPDPTSGANSDLQKFHALNPEKKDIETDSI